MTIRATKDSVAVLSDKLNRRVRKVCSTYYPDGELQASTLLPNKSRICRYTPNTVNKPPIAISTSGDSITGVEAFYPVHSDIRDIYQLKMTVIRHQETGEFKYWD